MQEYIGELDLAFDRIASGRILARLWPWMRRGACRNLWCARGFERFSEAVESEASRAIRYGRDLTAPVAVCAIGCVITVGAPCCCSSVGRARPW